MVTRDQAKAVGSRGQLSHSWSGTDLIRISKYWAGFVWIPAAQPRPAPSCFSIVVDAGLAQKPHVLGHSLCVAVKADGGGLCELR